MGFKYPSFDRINISLLREKDYATNLRKLGAGRLDGILIGSVTGRYLVQKKGLSDKIDFLPKSVGKVGLGIALAKTRFEKEDIDKFNETIQSLENSDEWGRVLKSNGAENLVGDWPLVDD